jgi:putative ABC transport system permease protein
MGWDVAGKMFDELRFIHGRKPKPGELRPAVLGAGLAETLGMSVGEKIRIEGEDFTVVGINQSANIFENSTAVVALNDLQDLMDRKGQVTGFLIVLKDSPDKKEKVERVRHDIEDLREENGRKIGVSAMATEAHVKSSLELRVVQAMAFSTSAIALFIGVIGILNTMMIAVFERTQEIGTLRAIGWPKSRVVRLILLESLILSLLGWLLGLAGSLFLTKLLSISPASSSLILPSAVSAEIMSRALLLAILAGIIGAAYPAVVAARLIPTEALRRD